LSTQQTGYPLFKRSRIQDILKREFDVIHYHNISLVGGPQILTYGHGIKLYTLHEYWLGCPTHVRFKFNQAACTRPQCLRCSLIYKRPPQWWRYSGLLEASLQHVDTLIAPSRFSQNLHREMGIKVPVVHLPHFIPSAETTPPTQVPSAPGASIKPYFLFVGRLEKLKGLQTLIPIFRQYSRARLRIAGTGTFEPHLRQLAAGSRNIEFLGHQSAQQLQTLYRQAVAVIVPSIWFEVFGLVILEAFQQGTPAIVSPWGGMPELIEESGGGFVSKSEKELISALNRLGR
jgi:glycosyltransferase involved in cell wall biosynthesis